MERKIEVGEVVYCVSATRHTPVGALREVADPVAILACGCFRLAELSDVTIVKEAALFVGRWAACRSRAGRLGKPVGSAKRMTWEFLGTSEGADDLTLLPLSYSPEKAEEKNPAAILRDAYKAAGASIDERAFAEAAAYCDEAVEECVIPLPRGKTITVSINTADGKTEDLMINVEPGGKGEYDPHPVMWVHNATEVLISPDPHCPECRCDTRCEAHGRECSKWTPYERLRVSRPELAPLSDRPFSLAYARWFCEEHARWLMI